MHEDIKHVKNELQSLKAMQMEYNKISNDFVGSVKQISEKYGYDIPFKILQEFKAFDADLKTNEPLRKAVVRFLYCIVTFN